MNRPRCPYCDKRLPKLTATVWVDPSDTKIRHQDHNGWRHLYLDHRPRNIAECRALTNRIVVSVTYDHTHTEITRFTEWDGSSYWTASKPFCKPDCAVAFARAAFRAGYRMVGESEDVT